MNREASRSSPGGFGASHFLEDRGTGMARMYDGAEQHRIQFTHEVASRPGVGWVCAVCDPGIYDEFIQSAYNETASLTRRIPPSRFYNSKVEIEVKEGSVQIEIIWSGRCDLFIGYGRANPGTFSLEEMVSIRREIDKAIDQMVENEARYGRDDESWLEKEHADPAFFEKEQAANLLMYEQLKAEGRVE